LFLSKNLFFKNNILDNFLQNNNKSNSLFFKNYDFIEKKLFYYKNNRNILKFLFNKKKKIQKFLNKFLKKFSKFKLLNFIKFFEFSLKNILTISNFFLNNKDITFFIKNNFIKVNNKFVNNEFVIVKKNDFVNLNYNKYYYFFYKNYINNLNNNVNKYNNFFKKNSKNDLNTNFSFLNKIIILKNDVPCYLEVDYISMTLIVLKESNTLTSFDLKLTNIFLRRLNN
jgi:ribosomal protein S4